MSYTNSSLGAKHHRTKRLTRPILQHKKMQASNMLLQLAGQLHRYALQRSL